MSELRLATLGPLLITDAPAKAAATLALAVDGAIDPAAVIAAPEGIPGRPEKPCLVEHIKLKPPSMRTPAGIAALVHAIAHIKLNAIEIIYCLTKYKGRRCLHKPRSLRILKTDDAALSKSCDSFDLSDPRSVEKLEDVLDADGI